MSDTHERQGTGTLQHSELPSADMLLHAGDLTFKGAYDAYRKIGTWAESLPSNMDLVMVPGNHDITFETQWASAVSFFGDWTVLNQSSVELQGFKIYGEPRQPEFYNWAYNVPRRRMDSVWAKTPTDTDILLTHGPPLGAGDLTVRGEHVGCEYQRNWILQHQPKLVVCGHIHNGYGIHLLGKTLVVNASICDENYRPVNKPIVVNIGKG